MEKIKRFFILFFIILFVLPSTFAEVSIQLPEKGIYNLGEKLEPSVSVKEDSSHNGFLKLNLFCGSKKVDYYTAPLDVEENFRTQVEIPTLRLFDPIDGNCKLRAIFESTDGKTIDSIFSEEFFVSNKIAIDMDENLDGKPGEDILISAIVKKDSSELLQKGEARITFKGDTSKADVVFGKLEHAIKLADDEETGKSQINVDVKDEYGNYGNKIISLKVPAVPSRIWNEFEKNSLKPGEALKVEFTLYDHSNNAMNNQGINVRLFSPDEKLITEKDVESPGKFEFVLDKNQAPGAYFLLSRFENVKEQSTFNVEAVKELSMRNDGSVIYVENVGNVAYDDEITLMLKEEEKDHLVAKKLNLAPGETAVIDLSKEVPSGIYNITDKTAQFSYENVIIEDNRPLIRKTGDGLAAISGAAVRTAGYVASKPVLASAILILIVLGIVTYYSKGYIADKIKGKKSGDTSNLFEDYRFEK